MGRIRLGHTASIKQRPNLNFSKNYFKICFERIVMRDSSTVVYRILLQPSDFSEWIPNTSKKIKAKESKSPHSWEDGQQENATSSLFSYAKFSPTIVPPYFKIPTCYYYIDRYVYVSKMLRYVSTILMLRYISTTPISRSLKI